MSADVFGLFCGAFCDFGDKFEISDANGEEPKETFIANITKVRQQERKMSHETRKPVTCAVC